MWYDASKRRELATSLPSYASRYSFETVSKQYARAFDELSSQG